jgi:predicted type IV restriction endonuclease
MKTETRTGLYIIDQERAKKKMKRAKIKSINNRTGEYLPGPKEEVKIFSKEQVDLVNKLVKLNISKVTAQNLQTYSKTYFIRLLVETPRTCLWHLSKHFKEVYL